MSLRQTLILSSIFFYKVKPKLKAYSLSQQLVSEPLKGSVERKPQLALHSV